MTIVYQGLADRGRAWQALFARDMPDLPFHVLSDVPDAAAVTYAVSWAPIDRMAERFPNLQVLFCSGAGVDQFAPNSLGEGVILVRMVEPGIIQSMVEYVVAATLMLHRDFLDYRAAQRQGAWSPRPVRTAGSRTVGVMGLGSLGTAVLDGLRPFGFALRGWNRSVRTIGDVRCFTGAETLPDFLAGCDILVCLLPLTAATRGILSAGLFDLLPEGASLVNVARGGHLVEADLLAALQTGRLSGAVLDVAAPEPLPAGHPFWTHPRILVTPHIASMTQPDSAGRILLDNVRRHRSGMPLEGVVDLRRGY